MAQKRHHNGTVKVRSSTDIARDWQDYRDRIGDRSGLFKLLINEYEIRSALYAGSYIDLSPSLEIECVTYVDNDRRAIKFFADVDAVAKVIESEISYFSRPNIQFIGSDYSKPLPMEDNSVDLLISLYAGFIWEPCHRYLKPGGYFLVNNSHGDAGIASLDERLQLVAVLKHENGRYSLSKKDLGNYITSKTGRTPTLDEQRKSGRGIIYSKSAFAYIFRLI
ncbi:unnamed protein product [Rotaria sp. Silwood1]|nr:unnamed protein product [Rotaria sp. Silwood1]